MHKETRGRGMVCVPKHGEGKENSLVRSTIDSRLSLKELMGGAVAFALSGQV